MAEAAVTVVDAWQRRCIGGLLLVALARAAERRGIRGFRAWVAPDNRAVLGFLAALGAVPVQEAPGLLRVDIELVRSSRS